MERQPFRHARRRRPQDARSPTLILVDTSVWIEVFRKNRPLDLEATIGSLDEEVTCLPVIQEVPQGFREETAYRLARSSMYAFPRVESPLGADVFDEAITLCRLARRAGVTIRSSVDCLIAACAIRHDLEIAHRDRDFAALASVSGLRARAIATPGAAFAAVFGVSLRRPIEDTP